MDTDELLSRLNANDVVVTAGRRLARQLHQLHARQCLANGRQVWASPDILPWAKWLQRLWADHSLEAAAADWQQLSEAQAQWLWRGIIDQEMGRSLYHVPALAQTAWQAWGLVQEWCLPLGELAGFDDEDSRAFVRWAQRYDQRCRQQRWLDPVRLPVLLIDAIHDGRMSLPQQVWLAGFDELTPLQSRVLAALQQAGVAIEQVAAPEKPASVSRFSLATPEAEEWAAAHWLRAQLQAHPDQRLALVVPDLQQRRQRLLRVLDQLLLPLSLLPGEHEQPRPYNVSLGESLGAVPMVADALRILSLGKERLPFAEVAALLRSPFIKGATEEASQRAHLDAALRQQASATVGVGMLKHFSTPAPTVEGEETAAQRRRARSACPLLHAALLRWFEQRDDMKKQYSPAGWAKQFAGLLGALGWPGERSLSSAEYQQQEAWRELLDQFAAMECVAPALNYGEALSLLRQLADQALFQTESPDAPVQVLGALETVGQTFDAVWVMGLHDEIWPPAPRPNPLLPVALQRQHGLPHASAERELAFVETVTRRLLCSAHTVLLSAPLREGDRERRPSPLITGIPQSAPDVKLSLNESDLIRRIHESGTLERLQQDAAPAFAGQQAAGGATLFRDQSACPFRAFAVHRLNARPLDEPETGLDAAGRGELVHLALESFWKRVRDHEQLTGLSDDALCSELQAAAHAAVAYGQEQWPDTFTERFIKLEQQRLVRLLQDWLQQERRRPPFVVEHMELRGVARVGALQVSTRIDRVDRLLQDDSLVVIDYKTGAGSTPKQWLGERPEEPQLPLYSQFDERLAAHTVSAVSVGRVRAGECGFLGLARDENILPGIKPFGEAGLDWAGLQHNWKEVLQTLAQSFAEGEATVDPRDDNACRYCHLMSLCRIHELQGPRELDDEPR